MNCELLQGCPFYNEKMPMENGIGSIYKKKYCQDNNKLCARYKVATKLGVDFVPNNLYPNMNDIAIKIIEERVK